MGRSDATAFVDLGDPANPRYASELPLTEGTVENLWRDIKVYADRAFIVADGAGAHGLQVFDLTLLRDAAGPPLTFAETDGFSGRIRGPEQGSASVIATPGGPTKTGMPGRQSSVYVFPTIPPA